MSNRHNSDSNIERKELLRCNIILIAVKLLFNRKMYNKYGI